MSGYDKSDFHLNVMEKVGGFVDVFHPYLEILLLFSFQYKKGGGGGSTHQSRSSSHWHKGTKQS